MLKFVGLRPGATDPRAHGLNRDMSMRLSRKFPHPPGLVSGAYVSIPKTDGLVIIFVDFT